MRAGDPVELELFRQLLVAIAEEMGAVLRNTAFSPNIKERRDYSCAVYNERGQTVAMGDHMPVHLGAMPLSVEQATLEFDLAEGDVVILNDPFRGGTHLPDITTVTGVFAKGRKRPSFYVATRAHHADVGGMSPGSMPLAEEIYQEGLRIPPILLVRDGRMDEKLLGMILANVRTPDERRGDLLAQLMAMRRGGRRLLDLGARYGLSRVSRNMDALMDYSERMMRATLRRELREGEYRFADCLDGDGVTDEPAWIRLRLRIGRGTAWLDFSGTDRQRPGQANANRAITLAAAAYAFRCLIREDVPFTAGLVRPIEIVTPEGSLVNAQPPAAMAAGNVETSQRITDVILGALAKAAPDLIPAASSGTMTNLTFGGFDAGRNRPFAYYETVAGGMGGGPAYPGHSGVHTHMTNSWNTPVEAIEHQFPVRVRTYALRKRSGGAGARHGGDGIVREIEFLEPARLTLLADRHARGPYGLHRGRPGKPGLVTLRSRSGERRLPAKTSVVVRTGDILRVETPGGGGHGRRLL